MTKLTIQIDISGDNFGVTDYDSGCGAAIASSINALCRDFWAKSRSDLAEAYSQNNCFSDEHGNIVGVVQVTDYKARQTVDAWVSSHDFPTQMQALRSLVPDMKITIAEFYDSNVSVAIKKAVDLGLLTVDDLYAEQPV